MPRPSQLATVPTEALVEEIQKRFAAIEKAKSLLFGSGAVSSTRNLGPCRRSGTRKRGGTSKYAQQISSLVQKIRHAKGRKESSAAFERELARLRASHKA